MSIAAGVDGVAEVDMANGLSAGNPPTPAGVDDRTVVLILRRYITHQDRGKHTKERVREGKRERQHIYFKLIEIKTAVPGPDFNFRGK